MAVISHLFCLLPHLTQFELSYSIGLPVRSILQRMSIRSCLSLSLHCIRENDAEYKTQANLGIVKLPGSIFIVSAVGSSHLPQKQSFIVVAILTTNIFMTMNIYLWVIFCLVSCSKRCSVTSSKLLSAV